MNKINIDIELFDFSELGFMFYKARMDLGLTQSELATICGVTKTMISLLETGKRPIVNIFKLMNLAKNLGFEFQLAQVKHDYRKREIIGTKTITKGRPIRGDQS